MQVQPVAIIGMAGRFPRAADLDEFWQNLVGGQDCLSTPSDQELLAWGERPERLADPAYVRRRPRIEGADTLDADLLELTPREAELHDPQHRLFLEIVHATLEHGGYDPATYPGYIGVYAGANLHRYRFDNVEKNPQAVSSAGYLPISIGGSPDYLSTFVSYKLGLRGPSMTILTACSTSLVAVHQACHAIRAGDCELAVAGGVGVESPLNLGYHHVPGDIYAEDGVVRPFDQHATGTVFGDGAGAVLLKSLAAARADQDAVYAVIRGSAINNDGDRKAGFTAPSVAGQSECVQRALRNAGVDPREISYLEAHATATPVGDPIELAGLTDAYRTAASGQLPARYCGIGTVKSNLGHLGQAAGIAGLIKTVLALQHQHLPPTINLTVPNPATDWEASPFRLLVEGEPWPRRPGRPRLAGVTSLGVGGTNAHVILQEAPEPATTPPPARLAEAVLWSAVDEPATEQLRDRLAAHFDRLAGDGFRHAAHTLRVGRTARQVRRAVVARTGPDAAAALRDPTRVLRPDGVERPIVFAFPGQAALSPRALLRLYEDEPLFRRGCDAAFDRLTPLLDLDLRTVWSSGDPAALAQPVVAQPLLFTLEYVLAHCLRHWGIEPHALLGTGLGELVAAAVAGVFDFESGLRAVAARARLLAQLPGPAGDPPDLAGARRRWLVELESLPLREPEVTVVLAATGRPLSPDQATSPGFWAGQLASPPAASAAAGQLTSGGPVAIVEVGPGQTLASRLRGRPEVRASSSQVWCLAPEPATGHQLEATLAGLWVGGAAVSYWHDLAGYRRVAVPGYPYQRRRYWIDPPPAVPEPSAGQAGPAAGGEVRVKDCLRELWAEALGLTGIADDDDFFALGGNSLVAVTLVNRIRERLDADLGAGALFEHSTINSLADALSRTADLPSR